MDFNFKWQESYCSYMDSSSYCSYIVLIWTHHHIVLIWTHHHIVLILFLYERQCFTRIFLSYVTHTNCLQLICFSVYLVYSIYLSFWIIDCSFLAVIFPFLVPFLKLVRRIGDVTQKSKTGEAQAFLVDTAQQMINLRKNTGSSPVRESCD